MRSRPLRGCLAALLTVLVVGVAPAGAQAPAPEDVLAHFRCYSPQNFSGDPTGPLGVRDQFGVGTISNAFPLDLCLPVGKTVFGGPPGPPPPNPDAHLVCYVEQSGASVARTVRVSNQFGEETLEVTSSFQLCIPASKAVQQPDTDPVQPPELGTIEQRLDHFRCYAGPGTLQPPPVILQDQFGTAHASLSRAIALCNPVEKQRPGFPPTPIGRPFAHLVCYPYSVGFSSPFPPTVATRTQFGIVRFFSIDTGRNGLLCVPSLKEDVVPPRVAQHFRSYRAEGGPASRELVTLVDQFGEASVRLGVVTQLMTPVEKRRGEQVEPVQRPDEHLTCYKIGGPAANRTVTVSDQFRDESVVTAGKPTKLCAPAAKTLEGTPGDPPSNLDHYKCYAVSGAPLVAEQVGLTDQFGADQVRVLRMKRLCNPVEKRRQGGEPELPPHPGEHLACYQVREPAGFVPLTVFTRDQFRADTLEVTKPSRLCVPAEKNEGGGDT